MDQQKDSENEVDTEKSAYLICIPVKGNYDPVTGSSISNCTECDDQIWISPESSSLAIRYSHIKPICCMCAYKHRDEIKGIELPTPEQIEEMRRELKRRKQ